MKLVLCCDVELPPSIESTAFLIVSRAQEVAMLIELIELAKGMANVVEDP